MKATKQITKVVLLILLPSMGLAQQSLTASDESTVSIYGTSNVHDWSEHCASVTGTVVLHETGDNIDLKELNFNVRVTDIKSGKNSMDNYTYEALLAEKHPVIQFRANSITTNGTPVSINAVAQGQMTIAGKSLPEKITAACFYSSSGLKCSGTKVIDMTNYGVEPPSIMFGAMTVGKEVEIHYEILFK
ncbi:MAG: YceI family protein [Cryomorphaceae bacterium]